MPTTHDSWGIEVGADAIKAIRLTRSGGSVTLADFEVLPFKKVLTTPDLNVDEAIQVNLDAFLAKHDVSKSSVTVSVPGHLAFARFAKLPPVEPKKIPDVVRFEAVQQIPFPIEQVEWDYQVFAQEDSPDVEVGIFAITKDRVSTFLTNYRRVNLRVDQLTLSPLAVYNAFSYDNGGDDAEPQPGTIYMDIGAVSTDVIIVEDGGIWLRTLPIGGNNFTDALVRAFKLSFPKAEKLKREAGTSKYARQIFQAMRPVFADLVQEVQRSLGYYQSLNRDSDLKRLVGVGSTFRLPGLQKFLKQQLQIEVTRPDGFKRIEAQGKRQAEFADHALNLATAYGLALQGLGLEKVSANILPTHIIKSRLWKAKQPWFAAAAALVAVGSVAAAGRYFVEVRGYQAALQEHEQRIDSVVRTANRYVGELQEVTSEADPRQKIENLRQVTDYRDLWPDLLADISLAAQAAGPQPELLQPNYEAIAQIPRGQRQRIYIDSVTAAYSATNPDKDQGQGQPTSGRRGDSGPLGKNFTVDEFFGESGVGPPRITVTLTGTTPFRDAARFISERFLQWFEDNGERAGRPYRLVETKLGQVAPVGAADPSGRSRDRGRDSGGGSPYGGGASPYGGSPYGAEGGFVGGGGSPYGGSPYGETGVGRATGRISSGDLASILPQRPLSDEDAASDQRFTAELVFELLPPDDARAGIKPEPYDSGEEGEETDGAPDAPEPPQPPTAVVPGSAQPQESQS